MYVNICCTVYNKSVEMSLHIKVWTNKNAFQHSPPFFLSFLSFCLTFKLFILFIFPNKHARLSPIPIPNTWLCGRFSLIACRFLCRHWLSTSGVCGNRCYVEFCMRAGLRLKNRGWKGERRQGVLRVLTTDLTHHIKVWQENCPFKLAIMSFLWRSILILRACFFL